MALAIFPPWLYEIWTFTYKYQLIILGRCIPGNSSLIFLSFVSQARLRDLSTSTPGPSGCLHLFYLASSTISLGIPSNLCLCTSRFPVSNHYLGNLNFSLSQRSTLISVLSSRIDHLWKTWSIQWRPWRRREALKDLRGSSSASGGKGWTVCESMAAHGEFAIVDPNSSFHDHILGPEEAKCPGTLRTEPSRSYSKAASTRSFGRVCLIHSVRHWPLWSHRTCQSVRECPSGCQWVWYRRGHTLP